MGLDQSLTDQNDREIGYWRKANQIHGWFVKHVQGGEDKCNRFPVSREQLYDLLKTVNHVLECPEEAASALPTQSGFFFGSTDYDDCYFKDLEKTKAILTNALAMDEKTQFFYQSSW